MFSWWAQLLALVAGSLGAVFLAISQRESELISESRPRGEVKIVVLERPRMWAWGLRLLLPAFGFQLAALILQRCGL